MQEIIASVDHIKFDLEIAVEQQLGAQPLPFPGMDKSGAAVCEFFLKAACGKGGMCPFRHISGEKTVVCKHWLRGLCKKGDQCEFLHEYDMTKMPECYFYSKFALRHEEPIRVELPGLHGCFSVQPHCTGSWGSETLFPGSQGSSGECSNKECPFLHIDPESKIKDCPWYDRGFCKHGPLCRHRHTRRVICVNYLVGFCPEGPSCKFMHPRFELPMGTTEQPPLPQQTQPPAKAAKHLAEPSVHPDLKPEPQKPNREPHRSSGSCRVKTAARATGDPGHWSRSPVTSVARKDTTPTDAPKGTWPFSVDSDSSWSQLRAARGPRCWECAFNYFMRLLARLWLELARRHVGFIVLRGHAC
ncbi:PREDICTED: cleavage and polyadenylation specificity factor subunit 4 isoform X3 [Cercocebus atys]|uniref:cleavage and polyadenylation specificity factor subunit 4 isoform X3 n=1 Tax=Cercocebus atys TaxID=9531 RepID=UPI0005F4ACFF|nr:PREDICTED: cleavage and polyadenylation specificity factor subunit 4 isoform X3 [Cercocebus atys]